MSCTAYSGPLSGGISLDINWNEPYHNNTSNDTVFYNTTDNTITSDLILEEITADYEGKYNCSVFYSDMPEKATTSLSATLTVISEPR